VPLFLGLEKLAVTVIGAEPGLLCQRKNKGKAIHLYEATLKILQNNPQACSQLQYEIDRIRPL
jgi:hypothetical protein